MRRWSTLLRPSDRSTGRVALNLPPCCTNCCCTSLVSPDARRDRGYPAHYQHIALIVAPTLDVAEGVELALKRAERRLQPHSHAARPLELFRMACGCRQQLLRLTCCRARPTGAVTGERKKTVLQGCRIALIGTRTASVSRSPQCSTPLAMDSGLVHRVLQALQRARRSL